jgi:hypothetical protein
MIIFWILVERYLFLASVLSASRAYSSHTKCVYCVIPGHHQSYFAGDSK